MASQLVACSNTYDITTRPPEIMPPGESVPRTLSRIREDFDNFELIDHATGTLHDVNRGLVSLPTRRFPELEPGPIVRFSSDADVDGVITGDVIHLEETTTLRASDSVMLVARDEIRVTGRIQAGAGGITFAAGHAIALDGVVESEGPVQIFLGEPDGTLAIRGITQAVAASSSNQRLAPGVTIFGRGRVELSGSLLTLAEGNADSGDVTIEAYGPVVLHSGATLSTSTNLGTGSSGIIRLRSESEVDVEERTRIGQDFVGPGARSAGDLDIEAPMIRLANDAQILGASSSQGYGASVQVSGDRITIGRGARLGGGTGAQGGSVTVRASALEILEGGRIVGGRGQNQAGRTRVEAAEALTLARAAGIWGGEGACADGGSANVLVAGHLTLGPEAELRGGASGTSLDCPPGNRRGGNVDVEAQSFEGSRDAIRGGDGSTPGDARLTADPGVHVQRPNTTASTRGLIESKLLDRGEAAIGETPVLREMELLEAPPGTKVHILLGGSMAEDELILDYVEGSTSAPDRLNALAGYRFFRYRVVLEGRAFDSPLLDYFEVDLAPKTTGR